MGLLQLHGNSIICHVQIFSRQSSAFPGDWHHPCVLRHADSYKQRYFQLIRISSNSHISSQHLCLAPMLCTETLHPHKRGKPGSVAPAGALTITELHGHNVHQSHQLPPAHHKKQPIKARLAVCPTDQTKVCLGGNLHFAGSFRFNRLRLCIITPSIRHFNFPLLWNYNLDEGCNVNVWSNKLGKIKNASSVSSKHWSYQLYQRNKVKIQQTFPNSLENVQPCV